LQARQGRTVFERGERSGRSPPSSPSDRLAVLARMSRGAGVPIDGRGIRRGCARQGGDVLTIPQNPVDRLPSQSHNPANVADAPPLGLELADSRYLGQCRLGSLRPSPPRALPAMSLPCCFNPRPAGRHMALWTPNLVLLPPSIPQKLKSKTADPSGVLGAFPVSPPPA